ncbi:hypothetical protein NM688_g279 [Phlebia brevispora]|uniref:Uncharacterized protein n=1 Tax=Phlebia brevispora TaxID=194682 RepID=A0ACC1TEF6_9APHY|nr:hypothetical protein NM688_g279 [Phlebia brevispora]
MAQTSFESGYDASSHSVSGCVEYLLATFSIYSSSDGFVKIPASFDLEKLEKQLHEVLSYVVTIKNATLPILRLPPEILGRTFELLQLPSLYRPRPVIPGREARGLIPPPFYFLTEAPHSPCDLQLVRNWPPDRPDQWMNVMLVCRRWCAIAVSCASLWANIIVSDTSSEGDAEHPPRPSRSYLAHVPRHLHNSQQHDLKVSLTSLRFLASPGDYKALLADVMAQASRFRELELTVGPRDFSGSQESYPHIRHPLSSLRALHLDMMSLQQLHNSHSPSLPEIRFHGGVPALRSLSLSSSRLPACNFRNLRQLRLSNFYYVESHLQFLALLKLNPALEDLILRKLAFQSVNAQTVHTILSDLSLPIDMFLYCGLSKSYAPLDDPSPSNIQLEIMCPRAVEDITKVQLVFDAPLRVYAAGPSFAVSCTTRSPILASAAPLLNRAQELWIDGWREADQSLSYRPHLAPNVSKVYCNAGLCGLLLSMTHFDTARPSPIPFSTLRELHITNPEAIEQTSHGLPITELGQIFGQFLQLLVDAQKVKQGRGCPLEVVYIYGSLRQALPDNLLYDGPLDDDILEGLMLDALREHIRVEFVRTGPVPRMHVPDHCRTQTGGMWNWPVWDARL